jgi:hypothetical protein
MGAANADDCVAYADALRSNFTARHRPRREKLPISSTNGVAPIGSISGTRTSLRWRRQPSKMERLEQRHIVSGQLVSGQRPVGVVELREVAGRGGCGCRGVSDVFGGAPQPQTEGTLMGGNGVNGGNGGTGGSGGLLFGQNGMNGLT